MQKRSIQHLHLALFDIQHQFIGIVVVLKHMHEADSPDLILKLPPCDVQQIELFEGLALLVEEGMKFEWADH